MSPKHLITVFSLAALFQANAQQKNGFNPRFQQKIKGDIAILANNILNRVDYNNSPNVAYYNYSSGSPLNDDFQMDYIDIDDDPSTFSSSSAELFFENPSSRRIIYAGLYWAGTYKYNSGVQKKEDKYAAVDPARQAVNSIKIKYPDSNQYESLTGTILYDGLQTELNETAPYVVYADVTDKLKGLANPNGVYTLANIRATRGTLKGGSAAGWTLFIVYEDAAKPTKSITTYDGFAEISSAPQTFIFSGFQTVSSGEVKAKIALGALEGDFTVSGDRVLFKPGGVKDFKPLFTQQRKAENFFSSAITVENKHFATRFPDSKNTLGYDTAVFSLANTANTLLPNNATEAQLKVESTSDKCYLFFAAFAADETVADKVIPKTAVASATDAYEIKKVQMIAEMFADANQTTTSSKNLSKKNSTFSNKAVQSKPVIEVMEMKISSQEKGFYVVTNAFTVPHSAKQYSTLLSLKGFDNQTFVNKINNYTFIYLKRFDTLDEAVAFYTNKAQIGFEDPLYLVSVNNVITGISDVD